MLAGVKVAVVPDKVTVPATKVVPCMSVKAADVIVAGSIVSLKVILTLLWRGTSAESFVGLVDFTCGTECTGSSPERVSQLISRKNPRRGITEKS